MKGVRAGQSYMDEAGDLWFVQGFTKVAGERVVVTTNYGARDGEFVLFSASEWARNDMVRHEDEPDDLEEVAPYDEFIEVLRAHEAEVRETGEDVDVWASAVMSYLLSWLCQRHGQMGATVAVANMVQVIAGAVGHRTIQ